MPYSKKKSSSTILLALVLAGVIPYVTYAIEYGGLGVSPNKSEVDKNQPLSKAWFMYELAPGAVRRGRVDIANTTDEKMGVRIYPVDAVTTADGAFAPEAEDKEKVGVGSWVMLSESDISLEPKEIKTIDFVIRVPENAEVGDHMGAIIAQSKTPPGAVEGSGLRITTRVGARMYITIPGNIVKELVFNEFKVATKDRAVTFNAGFQNKGNVRIRLKGNIEITDASDKVVATIDIPEREVFPQKTIIIPVEWLPEDVINGELSARATITYGNGQSLVQELSFPIPVIKMPLTFASVSSIGIGIGIGLIISLIFAGIFYLRGRKTVA